MRLLFYAFVLLCICSVSLTAQLQWARVAIPPALSSDSYWLDVYFLPSNPNYGWISGAASAEPMSANHGVVLRTTDGGITWSSSILLNSRMLESVHFATGLIGYASGPGGVFKSIDGGITWTDVTPNQLLDNIMKNGESGWGCYFYDANVGVYLAGGCSGPQYFCRTSDGGVTWTIVSQNYPESGLTDVILRSPDGLGYAVSSGLLWRTDNGGRSWDPWVQTGPKYWQEEITNINNSFLLPVSGSSCIGAGNSGSLLFTTDAGTTWNRYNTIANMFGTFLINEVIGWGVGSNARIFYTSDAGKNWIRRDCGIPPDENLDDIWFITPDIGWTVGRHIYKTVKVAQPQYTLTADKQNPLCVGNPTTLSVEGAIFTSYRWSNGATTPQITVDKPGKYYIDLYHQATCTSIRDSFTVVYYPKSTPYVLLSGSPFVCDGDTLMLSVSKNGLTDWQWSNGSAEDTLRVSTDGLFWYTGIDAYGCPYSSDTVSIKKIPPIKPKITPLKKTTFCIGDSSILSAPPGFVRYEWSNGKSMRQIVERTEGKYAVRVYDQYGCSGVSDSVSIRVLDLANYLAVISPTNPQELLFDDSGIRTTQCKEISIVNQGLKRAVLTPYFIDNTIFSLPPAQLPLIVESGEQRSFFICFSPTKIGAFRDTLLISDTCSPHRVPVRGEAVPIESLGEANCNIPILRYDQSSGREYTILPPFPNPASDMFQLSVEGLQTSFIVELYNAIGEKAASFSYSSSYMQSQGGPITIREQCEYLPTGAYTVILRTETEVLSMPLIINHSQ